MKNECVNSVDSAYIASGVLPGAKMFRLTTSGTISNTDIRIDMMMRRIAGLTPYNPREK